MRVAPNFCFSFWYHMFGSTNSTLKVYQNYNDRKFDEIFNVVGGGELVKLDSKISKTKEDWKYFQFDIESSEDDIWSSVNFIFAGKMFNNLKIFLKFF